MESVNEESLVHDWLSGSVSNVKLLKIFDIWKNCCNYPKIWTKWLYCRILCPESADHHHHHHHHIHFRALFSSTEGRAFWQVFLEGVLFTQNNFEGQQNPYLASFCHSQALHPMISLACQVFSMQPHSACVLLQSSLCCALHVQTISSYWCGAPHLSPGCQALWEESLS